MASQRESSKSLRLVDVNASPPHDLDTLDASSTAPTGTAECSSLTASVLSSKEWNLMWSVSKSNKSVKSGFGRHKSHRIVRIELLSMHSPVTGGTFPLQKCEGCFVNVYKPKAKTKMKMSSNVISNAKIWSKGTKSVAANDLHDDDLSDNDDEIDLSTKSLIHNTEVPEGWRIHLVFPIASVKINQTMSNMVNITMEHKFTQKHRNLTFDSRRDVQSFVRFLREQKFLEMTRTKKLLSYKITQRLPHFISQAITKVNLLIEIVSAWDLPAVDRDSSDPFVIVSFNGKEIHRTKHRRRTIDHAVWTAKTGSLLLLSVPISEFFRGGEGVLFDVQDFNQVSDGESLGAVFLSPRELYEMNGERVSFALKPLPGNKDYDKGHIAIRCRQATNDDEDFMYQLNANKFVAATNSIKASVSKKMGGRLGIKSTVFGNTKNDKSGKHAKMYRVRPNPDPDPSRKEDTTWMTHEQIEDETMQESQHWLETTVGKLGKVFVEVLGCDGLPNLDFGMGNKTDAFVAVVNEDSVFYTDVIDDCLSPRWLPWMKRAFVFNMIHTSSNVYVGVFDNDLTGDHDMIGRVSVDISNLRPNTTYTLKYNLYESARLWVEERKAKGSISIRVRIEVEDERRLLLSSMIPPAPTSYFNTNRKKDYKVVTQTCVGNLDMEQFGLDAIYGYTNEVYVYMNAIEKVYEAAESLIFWRSQLSMTVHGKVYSFPVHSFIAFLCGSILVERPFLFPAFFFGSVAWILIACMGYRRSIPKPWFHCRSFVEFLEILFLEKSSVDASIEPGINREEAQKVDQEFIEFWGVETEEAAKKNSEETEEDCPDEEIEEVNVDISTKDHTSPVLYLIKPYLDYIQDYLATVCYFCRGVKNILIWEECYISFWITFGCLVLSFISLFLPWHFILRWSSRITVWAGLGPWMRLVDIYYYTPWVKHENLSEEQLMLLKQEQRKQREENINEKRMLREDVMKQKAMKKIMFGNYITKVPVSKNDLYTDSPLPDSSAVPYQPGQSLMKTGYKYINVPGQNLTGGVIPKIENNPIGEESYHHLAIKKKNKTE